MELEQDCEEVIDENIGSVIRRNTINMKEIVNKLEKTIEYEHTVKLLSLHETYH